MTYRVTLHVTTWKSPAKLLMERNLRTRLDLLNPDTSDKVRQKQDNMKLSNHTGSNVRFFTVGKSVMVRDYRGNIPWINATVTSCRRPLTNQVKTDEGGVCRRHVDQMRRAAETLTEKTNNDALQPSFSEPTKKPSVPLTKPPELPAIQSSASPLKVLDAQMTDRSVHSKPQIEQKQVVSQTPPAERRYPVRTRKPTKRLFAV